MFTSFSGNPRRPRQVNLGGRKSHAFGSAGSGAGSQAAVDKAQQERVQRQLDRDRLQAANRIQRVWRGHEDRRRLAILLRQEFDEVEASGSPKRAYEHEDEAYSQLRRLIKFASIRNPSDIARIRRYAIRQRDTVEHLAFTTGRSWTSAYLELEGIVLSTLERITSSRDSISEIGDLLTSLLFLSEQTLEGTACNGWRYYDVLARVLGTLSETDHIAANAQLFKMLIQATSLPLMKVTRYTLEAYEAFGHHFLAIPVLAGDMEQPWSKQCRESLGEAINCRLLASSLAASLRDGRLQAQSRLADPLDRLRMLGLLVYFHRSAHRFHSDQSYSRHDDYIIVVALLLNSLPIGMVEPLAADEEPSITPTGSRITTFLSEQILSLVNQQGIGNLLSGSLQLQDAIHSPKHEEAKQFANYALALLRFFPSRGDEIRMWLYLGHTGSNDSSHGSKLPAIQYFWTASKCSSIFETITRDSKAAIQLLRPRSVTGRLPTHASLRTTQRALWQAPNQEVQRDGNFADEWRLLLVFLELYTFVMKVTDDEEFFGVGTESGVAQVRDNSLALTDVKDLTTFLKNLGFTLYFNAAEISAADTHAADGTGLSFFNPKEDDQHERQVEPSIGGVAGLSLDYVKGLVTSLLRMIYERDSRRSFLPQDHWLMTSRFDMTGFISSVVEEEENRHRIQVQDSEDMDEDDQEDVELAPQLIGTGRTQQQRRLERLQRQQRKASRRRYLQAVAPRLEILQNMPFFIPFTTRVQIFRQFVHLDMTNRRGSADPEAWRWIHRADGTMNGDKHTAKIRRNHEFDDAFAQYYNLGAGLKEPIQITFVDQFDQPEAGIDGGGVTKEFLTSVTSQAFLPNDDIEMFVENDQHLLFPNPASIEELKERLKQAGIREGTSDFRAHINDTAQRYEFLGRIIGKCLYEAILVDVNFAPFFLRKWALTGGPGSAPNESGYRPTLNDLRDLDEALYQGLHQLKNYDGDVEDFALNFTVTDTVIVDHASKKTKAVTRELKTDGANIPVTNQNRLVYISYVARHRLQNQPFLQTSAFLRGLSSMIQPSWLSMFNHSELQTLIGGTSSSIDVEDLRRNTIYGGTYVVGDDGLEHPTVQLFWKLMKDLNDSDRRAVLKFVTSTPRAPLLGFGTLNPRFSIRDAGSDQERLPSTSTCVNLLKLPMYRNGRVMKEKLLYSVFSGAGFDLS